MKKTLTVNLSGIVFHIDDDAYQALNNYLEQVESQLSSEDGKEIMKDIESRIAEIFNECLINNRQVISREDVEHVIEILGKPDQYGDGEQSSETNNDAKSSKKGTKRFYRDQENAILGGVASGLAAYLKWDVTLIRILFVILVFVGMGILIPIYLVLWIITPAAETLAQRLEMQGENITLNSIKNEFENAKSYVESDRFKSNATRVGTRLGEVFQWVFKLAFVIIGGFGLFIGVVVVIALIVALFALIFTPFTIASVLPATLSSWLLLSNVQLTLLIIGTILVVGAPIALLIALFVALFGKNKRSAGRSAWSSLVLFLIGCITLVIVGTTAVDKDELTNYINHSIPSMNYTATFEETRHLKPFTSVEIHNGIKVELIQSDSCYAVIGSPDNTFSSIMTNQNDARLEIVKNNYNSDIAYVKLYTPSVQSIKIISASTVHTPKPFKADNLKIELIGASKGDLKLIVENDLDITLMGASAVMLNGSSQTATYRLLGASKLDASQLQTRKLTTESVGASKADVCVTDTAFFNAVGASKIKYTGSPKAVTSKAIGGSKISKFN